MDLAPRWNDAVVRPFFQDLWQVAANGKPELSRDDYFLLHFNLQLLFQAPVSRQEYAQQLAKDWQTDTLGSATLDYDGFCFMWTMLAARWIDISKPVVFASFMRTVFDKVTARSPEGILMFRHPVVDLSLVSGPEEAEPAIPLQRTESIEHALSSSGGKLALNPRMRGTVRKSGRLGRGLDVEAIDPSSLHIGPLSSTSPDHPRKSDVLVASPVGFRASVGSSSAGTGYLSGSDCEAETSSLASQSRLIFRRADGTFVELPQQYEVGMVQKVALKPKRISVESVATSLELPSTSVTKPPFGISVRVIEPSPTLVTLNPTRSSLESSTDIEVKGSSSVSLLSSQAAGSGDALDAAVAASTLQKAPYQRPRRISQEARGPAAGSNPTSPSGNGKSFTMPGADSRARTSSQKSSSRSRSKTGVSLEDRGGHLPLNMSQPPQLLIGDSELASCFPIDGGRQHGAVAGKIKPTKSSRAVTLQPPSTVIVSPHGTLKTAGSAHISSTTVLRARSVKPQ